MRFPGRLAALFTGRGRGLALVRLALLGAWRHGRRSAALLAAVAFAACAFTVLIGNANAEQVQLRGGPGTSASRGVYDILVRPRDSAGPSGPSSGPSGPAGLLPPNFTVGQTGGITLAQYRAVAGLPGVQVAAPVALIGEIPQTVYIVIDITGALTPAQRQLFVASVTRASDQGLSSASSPDADFAYVTANPVRTVGASAGQNSAGQSSAGESDADVPVITEEEDPGGSLVPVCALPAPATPRAQARSALEHLGTCWSTANGFGLPRGQAGSDMLRALPHGHVGLVIPWTFMSELAAVDPAAEARLDGLDTAVVTGQYLPSSPGASAASGGPGASGQAPASGQIPVLVANQATDADTGTVTIRRLPPAAAGRFAAGVSGRQLDGLLAAPGPTVARDAITSSQAYSLLLAGELNHSIAAPVGVYYAAGPVRYASSGSSAAGSGAASAAGVGTGSGASTGAGGMLRARAVPGAWAAASGGVPVGPDPAPDPPDAGDTGVRSVTAYVAAGPAADAPRLTAVGSYAQARVAATMSTSVLPLEVYRTAPLFGADPASTRALGENQLPPDDNPAGYLTAPPTLLTSLSYLPALTGFSAASGGGASGGGASNGGASNGGAAPITTIRVRVAGVTGDDSLSRARIQAVASLISARTGLNVSVMTGAAAVTERVALPAGTHGRPPLTLSETWVRPAVAVAVAQVLDEGSLALFGLVLVVCAAFVANSALASLDARRDELVLLHACGWPRLRIAGLLMGESAAVALAAGGVAAAVAVPAGAAIGLRVTPGEALWSVPLAVALVAVAAGLPVLRACRPARLRGGRPRPPVRQVRLAAGGAGTLAARSLLRAPARNALALAAVTLSATGVTALVIVQAAFGGSLTGALGGQVISLQPRVADLIAAAGVLILLGGLMADLARLAVAERRAELALLRQLGWDYRQRRRLVLGEALVISGAGAAAGTVLAVAGAIVTTGSAPWLIWPAAVGGTAVTVAVAMLAAGAPAALTDELAPG